MRAAITGAVGATPFCMLSGRPVHVGETVNKVLLSAMSHRAPTLTTVLPDIPAEVAGVIDQSPAASQAAARPSSSARSRSLRVSAAARVSSARASSSRPSLKSRSPRTLGSRW